MSSIPVAECLIEPLTNAFFLLEKCAIWLPLTRSEWYTVLSGLKDAKKFKELCVYMKRVRVRATDMNSEVTNDNDVFPY